MAVKFGKLDIDKNRATALKYGVESIPTLIVYRDGEIIKRTMGARPKSALAQIIEEGKTAEPQG